MIDIASLLSLQARSRRNALKAARRLSHERRSAQAALSAADEPTGAPPPSDEARPQPAQR